MKTGLLERRESLELEHRASRHPGSRQGLWGGGWKQGARRGWNIPGQFGSMLSLAAGGFVVVARCFSKSTIASSTAMALNAWIALGRMAAFIISHFLIHEHTMSIYLFSLL